MDLIYKETEPFEKRFASHYLKMIVPLLEKADRYRKTAHKKSLMRLLFAAFVISGVILAIHFDLIDLGEFNNLPLEGYVIFSIVAFLAIKAFVTVQNGASLERKTACDPQNSQFLWSPRIQ